MSSTTTKASRKATLGHAGSLIPPLCLFLSACGGGGGSHVAMIPPPPPPPTTQPPPPTLPDGTVTYTYPVSSSLDVQTSWLNSPLTGAGSSDVLGRLTLTPGSGGTTSYRAAAPGEFGMTVADTTGGRLSYTLNAAPGILPGGLMSVTALSPGVSWDINSAVAYRYTNPYGDTPQYLGQRLAGVDKPSGSQLFSYDFTRGSTGSLTSLGSGTSLRSTATLDVGYSYVAMGEWSWAVVDLNGASAGDSGDLLFVNGDRTPASGIPLSGTATYDARTLSSLLVSPFTLTADFGQRTISTAINQDYLYDASGGSDGSPIPGIHVNGSAPFSNDGSFAIPLTGSVNYTDLNSPTTPPTQDVTGSMDGAFFGPHAEQVGGTFNLHRAGETVLFQDAFVGQQEQAPH